MQKESWRENIPGEEKKGCCQNLSCRMKGDLIHYKYFDSKKQAKMHNDLLFAHGHLIGCFLALL
jgi:hypothetical protein